MSQPFKKRKLEEIHKEDEKCPFYPVLPAEFIDPPSLIEVYIDAISNPKNISKSVIELNSVLPLPELNHLKRIKQKDILLFPTNNITSDKVHDVLKQKSFNISYLENNIRKVLVAKIPPKTKKQHEAINKLWPCNFHSNKYTEKLCTNTLFSSTEIESHINYMRLAIDVARFGKSPVGVIIVDSKINSVVAIGFDKRAENPCQHAIMVVVDNVAKTQNGGAWQKNILVELEGSLNLNGIPSDLLILYKQKYNNITFGATKFKGKEEIETPSDGPYLCTDYSAYVTHEPCIMCAMALIHSRIKRVFYGAKSIVGGLGTLCKIHTVKDLNHHYEVFAGLLEKECINLS